LHGPNAAHPSKPFLVVLLLVAVACLIYVTFPSLTNFGRRTYTPALRPTAPPTSFKSSDAVKIDASSDSLERGQVGGAPGNSNGESANKNGGAKNHMGAAARHVHANANVHKPAPVKTNSSLSKQLPKGSSAKSSADPWATLDRMR
jgi:hypothetical protein